MPTNIMTRLLAGTAVSALLSGAAIAADANARPYDIPQQDVATALQAYAMQSGKQVLFPFEAAKGKQSPQIKGDYSDGEVLALLAQSAGLRVTADDGKTVTLRPQAAAAPEGGDEGTVQALIVTAQKREENIQDVPIAMSAFSQEDLTRSQVAGGPDLMTQVPNMTFTKTNFSSYSIQLRGIGTQAISATTDAAVAVAFNNTPFIRNRFFEQEFYDLERVEVLRGPQGTLYGRNATAGVVNIISAKPKFYYEAKLSGDLGNYSSSRIEGMANIPLVEDKVALRVAGAWTKRNGYDINQITGNPIDGRNLWSTRVSLRVAPTDRIDASLIWEHFQENDDRLRSGKQLCKSAVVTEVGGVPVHEYLAETFGQSGNNSFAGVQARFSQGCAPSSLYSPDSFQTPTGKSLPYYVPLGAVFLPAALSDPYVSRSQSHDLRTIESTVDPEYQARNDLGELQVKFDVTPNLSLTSETAYARDFIFSQQDLNRFNTASGAWQAILPGSLVYREGVLDHLSSNGYPEFCDPQIGCADRLVALDLSTAKSTHFSEELRLSSNFDGPLNFSFGANYLRYDTEEKYYVFINSLSLISALSPFANDIGATQPYVAGQTTNIECILNGPVPANPNSVSPVLNCTYMDPNPIHNLNDQGHNYFLSKNPYKLISYAIFGEAYYNLTENLKVTAGLRWTVDKKEAPRIPSWLLASESVGYPVAEVIDQQWREPTGRLAIDWKPDLSFTDETLLYASYAHGYKAGGANPPTFVYSYYSSAEASVTANQQSATRPRTFDPEFVNAFEVGAKNTLVDGRMTLNLGAFYYDYKGYQLSEIVDRSAFNRNLDATVWGLEIEADWRPLENLRLGFKGGYEKTRIANGEKAIDLMDRTAGDPNWVLVRPFPTFASNCILPTDLFVATVTPGNPAPPPINGDVVVDQNGHYIISPSGVSGGNNGPCEIAYLEGKDPITDAPYVDLTTVGSPVLGPYNSLGLHPGYQGWNPATAPNHGEGIAKDLSGNELPNAPNFTATVTADYTIPLPNDWLATLHTDLYYQSEAWWRIFNTPGYDKLKAYTNVNLAAIFTNEQSGWRVMAYVKNVFDRDSITGAFLFSDDTDLTTNVFLTEPRLYGVRITKEFTGDPLLGSFGQRHEGPYPFTIEMGGQVERQDASSATYRPAFIDNFDPALDPTGKQNQALDWGDGREVKLTYAAAGGWQISLDGRYGKTNRHDRSMKIGEDIVSCTRLPFYCVDPGPDDLKTFNNYGAARLVEKEEHTIVDFRVGREVGLGLPRLSGSTVSTGLRYADFSSMENLSLYGTPDWKAPATFLFKYDATHHEYNGSLAADRSFKGAGPVLSWEASSHLLGIEASGHLDLDWAVSGGVLFGKQTTRITGLETGTYYSGKYYQAENPPDVVGTPDVKSLNAAPRSKHVIVPTFGASLGLSYKIDRFNVGAGYRWERYFDAIDGGIEAHKSYDRTIDGPYFKIAVGFGG